MTRHGERGRPSDRGKDCMYMPGTLALLFGSFTLVAGIMLLVLRISDEVGIPLTVLGGLAVLFALFYLPIVYSTRDRTDDADVYSNMRTNENILKQSVYSNDQMQTYETSQMGPGGAYGYDQPQRAHVHDNIPGPASGYSQPMAYPQ